MSQELLIVANLIIVILGLVGGYIGLRYSMSRARIDIQTKIREDLAAENTLLRDQIADLKEDNKQLKADNQQLKRDMILVFSALKKSYDLEIEVDSGVVTIRDRKNHSFYTVQADRHIDGQ